jgi:predicted nucleic acid-binding protein
MAWMRRQAEVKAETYLSVLVVGEVRKGIDQVRPRDPRQADALEAWLASLVEAYADRILPITAAIAEEAGRMTAACRPPLLDGLMAATAKVHRLTFVTRNVADVARTGVPVVNPFEG